MINNRNNFVDLDDKVAFIFNGCTFESNFVNGWCSIKNAIDFAVLDVIKKRGCEIDNSILKEKAIEIQKTILEIEF